MKQLFLVILLMSSIAHAQTERYTLGTHFGFGLSDLTNYPFSDISSLNNTFRHTFSSGLEIRRKMGETGFHLQSGIRWNGYGWRSSISSNGKLTISATNLSFVTIPLIATYKFNKALKGITLSAGPQFSFLSFRQWKEDGTALSSQWDVPDLAFSVYYAVGYERNIAEKWIIGGEIYSNLIPRQIVNFGLGFNLRYILKRN